MAQHESEMAVIGSILFDGACIAEADRVGLTAEDFSDARCRLAFEVIDDFRQRGKPFDDVLLIASEMSNRKPGDYAELMRDILSLTPTAANARLYCQQVKDNANRQKLSEASMEIATSINFGDWKQMADNMVTLIQSLKGFDSDVVDSSALNDIFLDYYDITKKDPENAFCKTGFADLDNQLGGGMFRSEVYIIGARPGMGKTTLGINIAQNIVNRGGSVLFISLEMSAPQIQAKRISLETGIYYTKLMTGRINSQEEFEMYDWLSDNKNKPFFLTTNGMTVSEIGRKARQIANLSCIIIDYIGLITPFEESRQKPKYEQMTEISANLKAMAKTLNVPVLALCQLNRESTARSDKRPSMADLRDSGAIEQDAGAIILLHRPDYYTIKESGETPEMEEIELNVAKNRHAEPGIVRMWWHGNVGKISMKATEQAELEELPF